MDLETVKKEFRIKIASLTIDTNTIMMVLQYAMEAVEVTTLSGHEKKEAVVDMIERAVFDAPMPTEVRNILLEMVNDGIISHTIDIIISASRGKLNVNSISGASQVVCTNIFPHLIHCITGCITSCITKKRTSN